MTKLNGILEDGQTDRCPGRTLTELWPDLRADSRLVSKQMAGDLMIRRVQ
jgi:hypothetical protein